MNEFLLTGDGGVVSTHPTKEAAIAAARKAGCEGFEVYDIEDRQVYAEWPQPVWR